MKRLEVDFETPSCALVRGYGARDLIKTVTKRSPVWATLSRAWVLQPSSVGDLVAVAEAQGWDVTLNGALPVACGAPGVVTPEPPPEPDGSLW